MSFAYLVYPAVAIVTSMAAAASYVWFQRPVIPVRMLIRWVELRYFNLFLAIFWLLIKNEFKSQFITIGSWLSQSNGRVDLVVCQNTSVLH